MKTCPFCAETDLQDAAAVCKHCRKELPATTYKQASGSSNKWFGYTSGLFGTGIVLLFFFPPAGLLCVGLSVVCAIVALFYSLVATAHGANQLSDREKLVAKICLPIIAFFGIVAIAVYLTAHH